MGFLVAMCGNDSTGFLTVLKHTLIEMFHMVRPESLILSTSKTSQTESRMEKSKAKNSQMEKSK